MTKNRKASADRQIEVGGRAITLRYSIKAMAALQDHWGLASFQEVGGKMQGLGESLSADDMVAIFWAGTRTHHPEIGKAEVLDLIDDAGIEEIQGAMLDAFAGGSGDAPAGKEGGGEASARPPARGRSTG